MTRTTALATLFALGLSTVVLGQPPDPSQTAPTNPHVGRGTEDDSSPSPAPAVSFGGADKDHDGKLDRSEASSVPGLDFARADTNHDSSLSREEFQTAMVPAAPRA
jgi:hypothetical protein